MSRTNGSQGHVALFVYDTGLGTAASGFGYTHIPASVIEWVNYESSNKTLNVAILNDRNIETDETIQLQIESTAYVIGGGDLGVSAEALLISDNDSSTGTGTSTSGSSNSESSGSFNIVFLINLLALFALRMKDAKW